MGKKEIIARALRMKPRCFVGYNGVTNAVIKCFLSSFSGTCVHPQITDVVRVKIQSTYAGSVESVIDEICTRCSVVYIAKRGDSIIFARSLEHDK